MSRLHRCDAGASLTTPPTAGVPHDVGKIAISETVLYRFQLLDSG